MPFQYHDSTIAAHELTIADDLDIARIVRVITGGDDSKWLIMHTHFATYQLGADVTGAEPIARITAASEPAAILTAFTQWTALPRRFSRLWAQELNAVEGDEKNG